LRRATLPALQRPHVHQVLGSADCTLVADQVVAAHGVDRDVAIARLHSRVPRIREREAVHRRQDVDPVGRDTDLDDRALLLEIFPAQVRQGSPEVRQRLPCPDGVLLLGLDPQVEVSGEAGLRVEGQRVASDD
jgi:hypothetical protein